jgi:hypothetical protein
MSETFVETQPAVKVEVTVQENGHIDIPVPFAPGKRVVVFIIQHEREEDVFSDLTVAATSSLDFWNNPIDDAEWNNA